MDRLRSKLAGCLLGAAVGDSLGVGGHRYTDDTAMMIGVAESLIERRGFDADHMARTFAKNYHAEPWRGYGPGPPMIFRMMESGLDFRQAAARIYPGGSYGNGSAMRVAPIGLFCNDDLAKLKEIAHQSSRITHAHELGMEGAALQACAVALVVKTEPAELDRSVFLDGLRGVVESDVFGEKLAAMGALLAEDAPRPKVIAELGNTVEAFNSIPISIYSFLANAGFGACLDYALGLGGDRDTIAAMTGAIAGACYGLADIPKEWLGGLENRDYIEELADGLWRLKTDRADWWGKPDPAI